MDPRGDHAAICAHGFGVVHRNDTVRNLLARHAFRAAGLSCNLEVPFLLAGSAARPAEILVQPAAPPAGAPPDRPIAYDVTVRSVYRGGTLSRAAKELAGAAEAAHVDKLRAHARTVREALHLPPDVPLPNLEWKFVPLAFDTLGAASARTMDVLETMAHRIANRTCSSYGTAKLRLLQRVSFAIWSNVASATIARMPYHGAALSSPAQV